MIIEGEIENELCVKCETFEDFVQYCKNCGFKDEKEFEKYTGAIYKDVEGKYFSFIGRYIIPLEEKKLWIEEYKEGVK